MAEAKKMMEDPSWQKEMKKLTNTKDFKDSIKKTQEALKDPDTAARAEAKIEAMAKHGSEQLKKGARSAMEEAMEAMANPEVMEEMQKMMRDPGFSAQMQKMMKDPSMKNYVDAVRFSDRERSFRELVLCSAVTFQVPVGRNLTGRFHVACLLAE